MSKLDKLKQKINGEIESEGNGCIQGYADAMDFLHELHEIINSEETDFPED